MREEEAESILLLLCAAFPSYEITPPTVGLWVRKLMEREFDVAKDAANRWIDERYKFPTIAEFWDTYENVWRERWEAQKKVLRLVPPEPHPEGMTTEQVHIWRASLGQPKENCLCDFCRMAREMKARQA
jgi:hypothetical protein